ncbi:hypothetical protein VDP25_17450 [Winogradskyella sp. ECml5-4]|uniref:hypothetical protein n=1 Tax=Winogradskyella sp. ECml5-4 TaxID=3110975 RepID=UPI002FF403B5
MSYTIEEYKVEDKLEKLNLSLPDKISFFPENLSTAEKKAEFIFTDNMIELNKHFKLNELELSVLGGDTELYRSRKNADIYLPAIFFSLSTITENSAVVSVALNVLSNYVYDALKGTVGKKKTHVEFHIETKEKGKLKKINYKGDVEGLKGLEKVIKAMK